MRIHKEGYKLILMSFLILVGVGFLINCCFSDFKIVCGVLYAALFVLLFLVVRFFRNPFRSLEKDPNAVYAPADGTIVVIESVEDRKYLNESRMQISIFMSPMNVHVNFYPISGEVAMTDYVKGSRMYARRDKASELNEHAVTVIEDKQKRKILVKQIAGAMARRIVCYAKKGDKVEQGDELGIIKFGSRVDVLLPVNARINVEMNQKVRAKQTILAYFE
jgi:phosphatidylserine decarboxylase